MSGRISSLDPDIINFIHDWCSKIKNVTIICKSSLVETIIINFFWISFEKTRLYQVVRRYLERIHRERCCDGSGFGRKLWVKYSSVPTAKTPVVVIHDGRKVRVSRPIGVVLHSDECKNKNKKNKRRGLSVKRDLHQIQNRVKHSKQSLTPLITVSEKFLK